jgi:hypothetical protein
MQTYGQGKGRGNIQGAGTFTGRGQQARRINPPNSNVYKIHNNWNVYYSCGFDVEDGHMSATCIPHWQKMNHQGSYTCKNAQQFINAGYDPCTKGMRKTVLPMARYT